MPNHSLTSSVIGVRFIETLDRLKHISSYEDLLSDTERLFVLDLLDKLELYKERTFVSVAQLNWINRIEEKCSDY